MAKVDCKDCAHFRSAPYEARIAGCFLPKNMPGKQKLAFLDEQQTPGDAAQINKNGDCADFRARPHRLPFWKRLWSVGA